MRDQRPYIVTVKLSRNPHHDPKNKVTANCRAAADALCTDATGEHHSFVVLGRSAEGVRDEWKRKYHVTRVELMTFKVMELQDLLAPLKPFVERVGENT